MSLLVYYLWACIDLHIMAGVGATNIMRELMQWPVVLRKER